MKYGLLKAAAVSPPIRVADTGYNAGNAIAAIEQAETFGAELLVLPELFLSSVSAGELFLSDTLISGTESALAEVIAATKGKTPLVFIGLPVQFCGKLFSAAAAVQNGKLLGVVPKSNITHDYEYASSRYFSSGAGQTGEIRLAGQTAPFGTDILFEAKEDKNIVIAAEIGEDIFAAVSPAANKGATVIAALSSAFESVGGQDRRKNLVSAQALRIGAGYIFASPAIGESASDRIFSGHNFIVEDGKILAETQPFSGGMAVAEIDAGRLSYRRKKQGAFASATSRTVLFSITDKEKLTRKIDCSPFVPEQKELPARAEAILTMQANALKNRLQNTGLRPILGVSGGLDSTLALLVCLRAVKSMGKDASEIIAVTMPGQGTGGKTLKNARLLIKGAGAEFREISIVSAVKGHLKDIGHDGSHDSAYENAQARERTQILMDIANKEGGLVVGTGDLSETALGWCTYNGDQMSMYNVNASIPKTLIAPIIEYEAGNLSALKKTLLAVVGTEISPELLPPSADGKITQRTEDIIGPYALHDFFLYHILRGGASPKKVLFFAEHAFAGTYTSAEIKKHLRTFLTRFFAAQFKRNASPDGLSVGSVSLSPKSGWKMPSEAMAKLWLEELEK